MRKIKNKGICDEEAKQHCLLGTKVIYVIQHLQRVRILGRVIFRSQQDLTIFIYIFLESFNLWRSLLMIVLYHQTKIPLDFWCRIQISYSI